MKKILLLVCVALSGYLSLSAQIATIPFMPVTSDGSTEHWYYVKCVARNTAKPTAIWLTGASTTFLADTLKIKEYTGGDEQRWKLVANGTGLALVNKAYGTYMNADQRYVANPANELRAVGTMPATAMQIIPSTYLTNGICLANTEATVTSGNYVASTITFTPYAAGNTTTGGHYNLIAYNANSTVNSSFIFTESVAKGELAYQINDAIKFISNVAIGSDPGQYSSDDITTLTDAIDYVKIVYNDPASTESQFSSSATDIASIVSLIKSNIIQPKLSNNSQDFWYLIKGTRVATAPYITSTGIGSVMKCKALTMADDQFWRLVPNTAGDGFVLQNKATQEYIYTDIAPITTGGQDLVSSSTLPTKGLKLRMTTAVDNKASLFFVENVGTVDFRLRVASTTNIQTDIKASADIWASWLFVSYSTAQCNLLKTKLVEANTLTTTLQIGSNPGQVTKDVMDEFKAAITAAQLVSNDASLTTDDYIAAMASLATANKTMQSKANRPVISTDANSVWYTLNGTRPATPSVIYNSSTDSVKYQIIQQTDSELWRFVANGSGYALQNKATLKYMACDSVNGKILKTQTVLPTNALKFNPTSELSTVGAFRFRIENDTVGNATFTFRLHAAAATPKNNTDNPNDNCGWLIADNTQSIRNSITALLLAAQTMFDKSATIIGSDYGKYPADVRATFAQVLTDTKSKDLNSMDYTTLQSTYQSFNDSYTAFANSRVLDVNSMSSTTVAPKWYYITANDPAGTDAYNRRVAINTDAATNGTYPFAGVTKNNGDSLQMWRFESTASGSNSVYIINAKTKTNLQVGSVLADVFTPGTHGNGFSVVFGCINGTAQNYLFCKYQSSPTVYYISAYGNKLTNYNTAWIIDAVEGTNEVKNTSVSYYHIRNNNGVITVEGVDKFEVYSVMGQRLNNKTVLRKGVYIVKIGNNTQKYIVQ